MGHLPEFLDYLHEQLRNGSIYVWGRRARTIQ